MNPEFWRGKRIFLTGHTGFKGSWLALWLQNAGASVHGFSLPPPTSPNLFEAARVLDGMAGHTIGDVRDSNAMALSIASARPEVVFHLAAQPLVRLSYADPVTTYSVNVLGTVNLLEAVRSCPSVRAFVNVTTDKCYQNREWAWGYRESEPLGGKDPYSSSKACSELVTAAYRDSFLAERGVAVGTARAGNVIGGGDWAQDRLIPDILRAMSTKQILQIRHPEATRPWQHVLEPLSGYLLLAECLAIPDPSYAGAWNFGPADDDARPVEWILNQLAPLLPDLQWNVDSKAHVHEATFLKLDSSQARQKMGWRPRWNLQTALRKTVDWHLEWSNGGDLRGLCQSQILAYQDDAKDSNVQI